MSLELVMRYLNELKTAANDMLTFLLLTSC